MAVVFWKIWVITKPGSVGLFSQKTGTVPALCQASKLSMPEWAVDLEALAGWCVRAAAWECSVRCPAGLMCLQSSSVWGYGLWEPSLAHRIHYSCACWAEQDVFFWICKQRLEAELQISFSCRCISTWIQTGGHKTLMCLFEFCMEELSVKMVQHHWSHRMMTVLLILWICCLLIFVHELRAIQRNYTHIAVPSGRTISKMKPLKAC